MSAILSADDLNDFISPGVACIKPVETLPKQAPTSHDNPYEVTTEDSIDAAKSAAPAQISLTDCLACSGCVTSAEAVLVSLQSHEEVLNTLNGYRSITPSEAALGQDGKVFVASVSPQTRASLAAMYGVSSDAAGFMIEQLLSGPAGLKSGGKHGSGFTWVLDTNVFRDICREACAAEALEKLSFSDSTISDSFGKEASSLIQPKKPILASACPGWICYAEKTHPHVLPHLSRLKSPQAIAGTFLKTILSRQHGVPPEKIWHVAIMPCFDKKLEASREELTDIFWEEPGVSSSSSSVEAQDRGSPIRDVDCVITARELLMLADSRGIMFPSLPRTPVSDLERQRFPDPQVDEFLFNQHLKGLSQREGRQKDAGTSGGYAYHILLTHQRRHPGSKIQIERGRNADVVDYILTDAHGNIILKTARYYGFRNIQNLVRRLKPARRSRMPLGAASSGARKLMQSQQNRAGQRGTQADDHVITPVTGASAATAAAMAEYAYVEVMACPGGCTNGGGQIKAEDAVSLARSNTTTIRVSDGDGDAAGVNGDGQEPKKRKVGPTEQKEWLARVDEAYYSADSSGNYSSDEEIGQVEMEEKQKCSQDADAMDVVDRRGSNPQQQQQAVAPGTNATQYLNNGVQLPIEEESHEDRMTKGFGNDKKDNVSSILEHWSTVTALGLERLVLTSYRQVESDVGKTKNHQAGGASDMERVAGLASSIGGGW